MGEGDVGGGSDGVLLCICATVEQFPLCSQKSTSRKY
jgi:hypothetical protein